MKLPMLANIDNGSTVDIGNNWSIGRRTHHVEVKQNFLLELKEAGIIEYHWMFTANNELEYLPKSGKVSVQ